MFVTLDLVLANCCEEDPRWIKTSTKDGGKFLSFSISEKAVVKNKKRQ